MGKMPLSSFVVWVFTGLFLATHQAHGNAMRCGQAVVSVGDHQIEVLKECGEPASIERYPALLVPGATVFGDRFYAPFASPLNPVSVEVWTYNFGPRRLMRQVRLEGGAVAEIRTLGYGF
ncbi:MAG: DUF2845 domain-containing protein [Pseudomonadota bacterium]